MRFLKLVFIGIASTTVIFCFGYFYNPKIKSIIDRKIEWLSPCSSPITYSITNFSDKFNISGNDFKTSLKKAEKIWEDAVGKDLFSETENNGNVSVNLIYDDRQSSTDKLKKLGFVIENDKAGFETLKQKYNAMKTAFEQNKKSLEKRIAELKVEQASYEKTVSYWNDRGGAPKDEYNRLQKQGDTIKNEIAKINKDQISLNDSADTLNSLGTVINQQITNLNLNVEKFNSTREETGGEFDEGEYVENSGERSINIYQFDNKEKLVRVLAHELGHALGLDHNDNPKSVMYKLNQGSGLTLSAEDTASLKEVCGVK